MRGSLKSYSSRNPLTRLLSAPRSPTTGYARGNWRWAIATVLGLQPTQINISVTVVTQEEVDLHFGVYERMLAEKLGVVSPIQ
ncbi:hypothetical protein AWB76_07139 [Caballeronia temeraria]|uniref:Uncharacterized protein n=1 Tax=Caballeronia temeraria TaxID=1777137 RepID=A0A158DLB1_9BURK|nr:hypothetical protein AWB76_07139 [Caballeronia temeraria]